MGRLKQLVGRVNQWVTLQGPLDGGGSGGILLMICIAHVFLRNISLPPFVHPFSLFVGGEVWGALGGGFGRVLVGRGRFQRRF